MTNKNKRWAAFTIVELLVVIVIIGILAAITVSAYNGIRERSVKAMVQSDLSNAAKLLQVDHELTGAYPTSVEAANSSNGLKASPGVSYQYSYDNDANPDTFCLTATRGSLAYYISSTNRVVTQGACTGHTLAYTNPEVIEVIQTTIPTTSTATANITTALEPNDLVVVFLGKNYNGTVTVSGYSQTWSSFYTASLYTGSTAFFGYKATGLSGIGTITFNGTSHYTTAYATTYVIRGLSSPNAIAQQEAGWGQAPTYNVDIGPAPISVGKNQVALFVGVAYSATGITFLNNPSPASGWVTSSAATGSHRVASGHLITSSTGTVQASMRSTSNTYIGNTMFVVGNSY